MAKKNRKKNRALDISNNAMFKININLYFVCSVQCLYYIDVVNVDDEDNAKKITNN